MAARQTGCDSVGNGNEGGYCGPAGQNISNNLADLLSITLKFRTFAVGKSFTTSSSRIPQGGNAARVSGCSGAIKGACPFFVLHIPTSLSKFASHLITIA